MFIAVLRFRRVRVTVLLYVFFILKLLSLVLAFINIDHLIRLLFIDSLHYFKNRFSS